MRFLTHAELAELTERKRKGEQIAWLKANGYHYATGANGHPRVLSEHVQARLCGGMSTGAPTVLEPNWNAM
ncbi:MAG: DUF4224 domain-containing protein [Gallionella sp.]|nr:DUF4224 domain-containing protein [Gallionella sp.]